MELDFSSLKFCGREVELKQLLGALDVVQGNAKPSSVVSIAAESTTSEGSLYSHEDGPQKRIVMVEGAAGVGKTMLVERFLNKIELKRKGMSISNMGHYSTASKYEQQAAFSLAAAEAAKLAKSKTTAQGDITQAHSNSADDNEITESSATDLDFDDDHSSLLLVARCKFEEGPSVPFAAISDLMGNLIREILSKDPDWPSTVDKEARKHILRIASIVPKIRKLWAIEDLLIEENGHGNGHGEPDTRDPSTTKRLDKQQSDEGVNGNIYSAMELLGARPVPKSIVLDGFSDDSNASQPDADAKKSRPMRDEETVTTSQSLTPQTSGSSLGFEIGFADIFKQARHSAPPLTSKHQSLYRKTRLNEDQQRRDSILSENVHEYRQKSIVKSNSRVMWQSEPPPKMQRLLERKDESLRNTLLQRQDMSLRHSPNFQQFLDSCSGLPRGLESARFDVTVAGEDHAGASGVDESGGDQWSFQRCRLSLRTFFRKLCSKHTVVLFLDDFQWADEMSMQLIQPILADKRCQRLLMIGTRRGALPTSSPVYKFLYGGRIPRQIRMDVELGDWECDAVCDFVSHILHRPVEEVRKLAEVVHQKTHGTIYYVIQYLRLLYDQKLIYYSMKSYRWEYSMSRIAYETDLCENVSKMMGAKIGRLELRVQIPILTAAFLGFSRFDSEILLQVVNSSPACPKNQDMQTNDRKHDGDFDGNLSFQSESSIDLGTELMTLDELTEVLDIAIREGMISKMPYFRRLYKFSHDRVREGALDLIPTGEQRTRLHLRVGRQLRRILLEQTIAGRQSMAVGIGETSTSKSEDVQRLLLLSVNHLNQGSDAISDTSERVQLARMNLEAAEAVLQQSAFSPALEYLQHGIVLLDRQRKWEDHYELALRISAELSHVLFCNGQHDDNWHVIDDVLTNAKCLNDKLSVCRTLINALVAEGRFEEAVETNMDVLDELGIRLPRRNLPYHIVRSYLRTRRIVRHKSDDELLDFTERYVTRELYQCDFLILLMETCMASGDLNKQILATLEALWLVMDRGIEDMAAIAMSGMGYLHGLRGRNDKSHRFGKLAIKLASEGRLPSLDSRAMSYAYQFLIPWKQPYHDCLEPMLQVYKMALERGDIEQIFRPIMSYSIIYFHCGLRLEPLRKDMLKFVEILEHFGQTASLALFQPTVELVLGLMGSQNASASTRYIKIGRPRLKGDGYVLSVPHKDANRKVHQSYYRHQLILAYYFGAIELADEMSSKLNPPLEDGPVAWLPSRFYFQALVAFAMAGSSQGGSKRRKYFKRGRKFVTKLEKISNSGNVNCTHLVQIVKAEELALATKGKDHHSVQQAYDKAVAKAGRRGFMNDQALANELAATYFLRHGDREWAKTYLERACELYFEWGAVAKCAALESQHKDLLEMEGKRSVRSSTSHGIDLKARTRVEDRKIMSRRHQVSKIAFKA